MKNLSIGIQGWLSRAFDLSSLQKSRLPWVDYLKGLAILLVVYRHVLIGIERNGIDIPAVLVNANMIFYSFRMPLFFILSGVFISMSLSKRNLGKIISIKFENLLYPYLIWVFIQISIQIVFSGSTNASRSAIDYTYIFYQPRSLDQFWYLPALFNTTLVYLLVKTKLKPPAWMQLILGLVLYFSSPYFQKISMISDWMEFYFFFALGDAITIFFFKESTQKFLKKPALLLLLVPVFALVQMYYLTHDEFYYLNDPLGKTEFLLIALTGCFSMLVLAFRLQSLGMFRFLRVLGYHSIYIYVMHVIVAACIRIILTKLFGIDSPIPLLMCGIFFGVVIPVMFYNLLGKNHMLWFLFTYRRPQSRQVSVRKAQTITPKVNYESTAG
jgi:fucose 4-O-acetylase-like acetyltransferase